MLVNSACVCTSICVVGARSVSWVIGWLGMRPDPVIRAWLTTSLGQLGCCKETEYKGVGCMQFHDPILTWCVYTYVGGLTLVRLFTPQPSPPPVPSGGNLIVFEDGDHLLHPWIGVSILGRRQGPSFWGGNCCRNRGKVHRWAHARLFLAVEI
jgi:hypothetical protein